MFRERKFPLHSRIPEKFKEYRESGLFIDITLTRPNAPPLQCHRLVLARYSGFFRTLFERQSPLPRDLKIRVPFDCDGAFESIIDFFYCNHFQINKEFYQHCFSLHILASFYDIPTLLNFSSERLQEPSKNDIPITLEKELFVKALSVLKNCQIMTTDQHLIETALSRVHSGYSVIITSRWGWLEEVIETSFFLETVPPHFFAQILTKMDKSNESRADLIERYIKHQKPNSTCDHLCQQLIGLIKTYICYFIVWISDGLIRKLPDRLLLNS
jgi:hypothetical protein